MQHTDFYIPYPWTASSCVISHGITLYLMRAFEEIVSILLSIMDFMDLAGLN